MQPQQPPSAQHPLPFRLLPTAPSAWTPRPGAATLNVRLDGCLVPSEACPEGGRVSYSHLVVLDDFIEESTRQELLDLLIGPGPLPGSSSSSGGEAGPAATAAGAASMGAKAREGPPAEADAPAGEPAQPPGQPHGLALPRSKWERGALSDMAGGAPSWGARPALLAELARMEAPAMQQVHARLQALLPGYELALLPSEAIQGRGAGTGAGVDCGAFVCNAACEGDSFAWHVDADPTSFPAPTPWTEAYGDYFNGEPGKPLLASLMLYLNPAWERDWGGETLFLDAATDAGVFVRPRPRRAVLFHQDLLHRVTPPAPAAAGRPRFSLVWKLALLPRAGGGAGGGGGNGGGCGGIAPPDWAGVPTSFGSAARVDAVMRQLGAELAAGRKRRRAGEQEQQAEDEGTGARGGRGQESSG